MLYDRLIKQYYSVLCVKQPCQLHMYHSHSELTSAHMVQLGTTLVGGKLI